MNKKTQLTAFFLYTLSGVSPLLVIKIINNKEFLDELVELIRKYKKAVK